MEDIKITRSDQTTLKALNLSAYQRDDNLAKQLLGEVAGSPVVVLETPKPEVMYHISRGDSLKKVQAAGLDCLHKPFFSKVVYTDSHRMNRHLFVDSAAEGDLTGLAYTDKETHMGLCVPVLFGGRHFDTNIETGEIHMDRHNALDLASVKKSAACRNEIKRAHREYLEDQFVMNDSAILCIGRTVTNIKDGKHELSVDDIASAGLSVGEYVLANAIVYEILVSVILNLGYMHTQDYYPFAATSRTKKKKKSKSATRNPILNPNLTVIRLIRRDVAERHISDSGGDGKPKKPHARRGCWVTLNADRYQNHPMYKVKNGVYRRESWVGCEPFSIGNVLYTPHKH